MNYEEEAKNIVNMCSEHITRKGNTSLKTLSNLVAKALCKASGKPEHELKSGDHVLVSNRSDTPNTKAIFLYKYMGEFFVHMGGRLCINAADNIIPDPAYKHTLQVIEHDGSKECPHDMSKHSFRVYPVMVAGGLGDINSWDRVTKYAVVPEEWFE